MVPSAFHVNQGATAIRQLYFEHNRTKTCFSFENKRKLFEIHSSFKFVTLIAQVGKQTEVMDCAFYLHDDEWLFARDEHALRYNMEFVRNTGGDYLSLLELKSRQDLEIAELCFKKGEPFGDVCERLNIQLGRELHMTDDAWRFTPTEKVLPDGDDPRDPDVAQRLLEMGYLTLHEGKTFWHYNDHWEERPSYLLSLNVLAEKERWLVSARYYRFAYRAIASSTNERTVITTMLPPQSLLGNSAPVERTPYETPHIHRLNIIAMANTFAFDWTARIRIGANLNKFILLSCPLVKSDNSAKFLVHSALRLSCNHSGYTSLWIEQVGDAWREPSPLYSFPVLRNADEHWDVRSAIDAVVAEAYDLSREQYKHVLSSFSHASYPKAPELCLEKYDELKTIGLEAFTKKYDPYWDIPLNEDIPKPVIEIPGATAPEDTNELVMSHEPPKNGRRRKK